MDKSKKKITLIRKKTLKTTNKQTTTKQTSQPYQIITIKNNDDTKSYIINTENNHIVSPKIWELPNRKRFYDWILKTFDDKYNNITQNKHPKAFNPKHIQRLIHDFMTGKSPYRGLLLYYGLGVGKSCSALAISETINNIDKVLFLSKTSLETNFINEIKFCGAEYMRTLNHWDFCHCDNEFERKFAEKLGITSKMIANNGGAFFINYEKKIILIIIFYHQVLKLV